MSAAAAVDLEWPIPVGSPRAAEIVLGVRAEMDKPERKTPTLRRRAKCACGFCLSCVRRLEKEARRKSVPAPAPKREAQSQRRPPAGTAPREPKPKPEPKPCECGCGEIVRTGARFRHGHALRARVKTPEGRAAQSAAATKRWERALEAAA